ncbi:SDR family NAD(P)-dependent oxidoreductase [Tistlia consotensis]|uniref:SDR family NAD(P)-dependent oxidoreductase n=1 Tax=Tistlia consotensis TaxID=1321365 RepID=UPI00190E6F8E|nr:SDR family NAD(P)-dependent oxidoreductase [Tistlia consotensis]
MNGDPSRLAGQCAVVTGGSRGIGLAVARRLLADGAAVSLWARDQAVLEAASGQLAAGARVSCHCVDVSNPDEVSGAADQTRSRFGRVDILVNNAGILGPRAAVGDYPHEAFETVLAVNLTGTFNCCSAIVPEMVRNGYGRVVNVASVVGKDGNPFVSGYAASKAGQIALTKSLAKEVARSGVLVNAVTPSASETEIFGRLDDDRRQKLLANVPMGRFVEPGEIANLVAWLCSPECSFSTGAVFDISGGRASF